MLFAYYITYNLYCATKWPFPRRRKLDFGLEFERNGFEEHFIFTEGSSKPIRDDQVIRVALDFGHCTTTINVWERIGEKHLAQLVGEGACQPDIFTKYRLGCELSYGTCSISLCAL